MFKRNFNIIFVILFILLGVGCCYTFQNFNAYNNQAIVFAQEIEATENDKNNAIEIINSLYNGVNRENYYTIYLTRLDLSKTEQIDNINNNAFYVSDIETYLQIFTDIKNGLVTKANSDLTDTVLNQVLTNLDTAMSSTYAENLYSANVYTSILESVNFFKNYDIYFFYETASDLTSGLDAFFNFIDNQFSTLSEEAELQQIENYRSEILNDLYNAYLQYETGYNQNHDAIAIIYDQAYNQINQSNDIEEMDTLYNNAILEMDTYLSDDEIEQAELQEAIDAAFDRLDDIYLNYIVGYNVEHENIEQLFINCRQQILNIEYPFQANNYVNEICEVLNGIHDDKYYDDLKEISKPILEIHYDYEDGIIDIGENYTSNEIQIININPIIDDEIEYEVKFYYVDNTATADIDYLKTLTATIKGLYGIFYITALDNSLLDGTRMSRVYIEPSSQYNVGASNYADIEILDNEEIADITLNNLELSELSGETSINAKYTVFRYNYNSTANGTLCTTFDYEFINGTGINGTNFIGVNGTGSVSSISQFSIPLTIIDNILDGDFDFQIKISNIEYGLETEYIYTITIRDDEELGLFNIDSSYNEQKVTEGDTIGVTVTRIGGGLLASRVYFYYDINTPYFLQNKAVQNEYFAYKYVDFAYGEMTKTLDLNIIDNNELLIQDKMCAITIGTDCGEYTLYSNSKIIIYIVDNEIVPSVEFEQLNYEFMENATTGTITLKRDSLNFAAGVNVSVYSSGNKYTGISASSVNFSIDQETSNLTISWTDNNTFDYADEYLTIQIAAQDNFTKIGSIRYCRVRIVDNESRGIITFEESHYQVDESGTDTTTVSLNLIRTGGSYTTIQVTINYDGYSIENQQFNTIINSINPQVITFHEGITTQTVLIQLPSYPYMCLGDITFNFHLSSTYGVVNESNNTTSIKMIENNKYGYFTFDQSNYFINIGESIDLNITRTIGDYGSFDLRLCSTENTTFLGSYGFGSAGLTNKIVTFDHLETGTKTVTLNTYNYPYAPNSYIEIALTSDYDYYDYNGTIHIIRIYLGDPNKSIYKLSSKEYEFNEQTDSTMTFEVLRNNDVGSGSIDWTFNDTLHFDIAPSGTLYFEAGEKSKLIEIGLLDNNRQDYTNLSNSIYTLTLSNPSDTSEIDESFGSANVKIIDTSMTIGFESANYFVNELDGQIVVKIIRDNISNLSAENFKIRLGGNAVRGVDYVSSIFYDQNKTEFDCIISANTYEQDYIFDIYDNYNVNTARNITLEIFDVNALVTVKIFSTTITIIDDEVPLELAFEESSYFVDENGTSLPIQILDVSSNGKGNITYRLEVLENSTAHLNEDFTINYGVTDQDYGYFNGQWSNNAYLGIVPIDNDVTASKVAYLKIVSLSGGIVENTNYTTIFFRDDELVGIENFKIMFNVGNLEVDETAGYVDIQLNKNMPKYNSIVEFELNTLNYNAAIENVDFYFSKTISISANNVIGSLRLYVIDNDYFSTERNLVIKIKSVTIDGTVYENAAGDLITIKIIEDEIDETIYSFELANDVVSNQEGEIYNIKLNRSSAHKVEIVYIYSEFTGSSENYNVTFEIGEYSKSFGITIPIENNFCPIKTAVFTLSLHDINSYVGENDIFTLTILESAKIKFSNSFNINKTENTITIPLQILGTSKLILSEILTCELLTELYDGIVVSSYNVVKVDSNYYLAINFDDDGIFRGDSDLQFKLSVNNAFKSLLNTNFPTYNTDTLFDNNIITIHLIDTNYGGELKFFSTEVNAYNNYQTSLLLKRESISGKAITGYLIINIVIEKSSTTALNNVYIDGRSFAEFVKTSEDGLKSYYQIKMAENVMEAEIEILRYGNYDRITTPIFFNSTILNVNNGTISETSKTAKCNFVEVVSLFGFAKDNYVINAGDTLSIPVIRFSGQEKATLSCRVINGSAKENENFTISNSNLNFSYNENQKEITINSIKEIAQSNIISFEIELMVDSPDSVGTIYKTRFYIKPIVQYGFGENITITNHNDCLKDENGDFVKDAYDNYLIPITINRSGLITNSYTVNYRLGTNDTNVSLAYSQYGYENSITFKPNETNVTFYFPVLFYSITEDVVWKYNLVLNSDAWCYDNEIEILLKKNQSAGEIGFNQTNYNIVAYQNQGYVDGYICVENNVLKNTTAQVTVQLEYLTEIVDINNDTFDYFFTYANGYEFDSQTNILTYTTTLQIDDLGLYFNFSLSDIQSVTHDIQLKMTILSIGNHGTIKPQYGFAIINYTYTEIKAEINLLDNNKYLCESNYTKTLYEHNLSTNFYLYDSKNTTSNRDVKLKIEVLNNEYDFTILGYDTVNDNVYYINSTQGDIFNLRKINISWLDNEIISDIKTFSIRLKVSIVDDSCLLIGDGLVTINILEDDEYSTLDVSSSNTNIKENWDQFITNSEDGNKIVFALLNAPQENYLPTITLRITSNNDELKLKNVNSEIINLGDLEINFNTNLLTYSIYFKTPDDGLLIDTYVTFEIISYENCFITNNIVTFNIKNTSRNNAINFVSTSVRAMDTIETNLYIDSWGDQKNVDIAIRQIGGTATSEDYEFITQSVIIPYHVQSAYFAIKGKGNILENQTKTIIFEIYSPSGIIFKTYYSTMEVTLYSNLGDAQIGFTKAAYEYKENESYTIYLTRTGNIAKECYFGFGLQNNEHSIDILTYPYYVKFERFETEKSVKIKLNTDNKITSNFEDYIVLNPIPNMGESFVLRSKPKVNVENIESLGEISFTNNYFEVVEGQVLELGITHSVSSIQVPVTIKIQSTLNYLPDFEFAYYNRTITSLGKVYIPTLSCDILKNADRNYIVTALYDGILLAETSIKVIDNAVFGNIEFADESITINEDEDFSIKLERDEDSNCPVSLAIFLQGDLKYGIDYILKSTDNVSYENGLIKLSFDRYQTEKTIIFTSIDNNKFEKPINRLTAKFYELYTTGATFTNSSDLLIDVKDVNNAGSLQFSVESKHISYDNNIELNVVYAGVQYDFDFNIIVEYEQLLTAEQDYIVSTRKVCSSYINNVRNYKIVIIPTEFLTNKPTRASYKLSFEVVYNDEIVNNITLSEPIILQADDSIYYGKISFANNQRIEILEHCGEVEIQFNYTKPFESNLTKYNTVTIYAESEYFENGRFEKSYIYITPGLNSIFIPILNNTIKEQDRYFDIVLGILTPNINSSVVSLPAIIRDGESTISVSDKTFIDSNPVAYITLTRMGSDDGEITINYNTIDKTAVSGTHFTAINNGTVTFLPGEKTKTIEVELLMYESQSDTNFEIAFTCELDYVNLTEDSITCTIKSGVISFVFDLDTIRAIENGGEYVLNVTRNGSLIGDKTVSVELVSSVGEIDILSYPLSFTSYNGIRNFTITIMLSDNNTNDGSDRFAKLRLISEDCYVDSEGDIVIYFTDEDNFICDEITSSVELNLTNYNDNYMKYILFDVTNDGIDDLVVYDGLYSVYAFKGTGTSFVDENNGKPIWSNNDINYYGNLDFTIFTYDNDKSTLGQNYVSKLLMGLSKCIYEINYSAENKFYSKIYSTNFVNINGYYRNDFMLYYKSTNKNNPEERNMVFYCYADGIEYEYQTFGGSPNKLSLSYIEDKTVNEFTSFVTEGTITINQKNYEVVKSLVYSYNYAGNYRYTFNMPNNFAFNCAFMKHIDYKAYLCVQDAASNNIYIYEKLSGYVIDTLNYKYQLTQIGGKLIGCEFVDINNDSVIDYIVTIKTETGIKTFTYVVYNNDCIKINLTKMDNVAYIDFTNNGAVRATIVNIVNDKIKLTNLKQSTFDYTLKIDSQISVNEYEQSTKFSITRPQENSLSEDEFTLQVVIQGVLNYTIIDGLYKLEIGESAKEFTFNFEDDDIRNENSIIIYVLKNGVIVSRKVINIIDNDFGGKVSITPYEQNNYDGNKMPIINENEVYNLLVSRTIGTEFMTFDVKVYIPNGELYTTISSHFDEYQSTVYVPITLTNNGEYNNGIYWSVELVNLSNDAVINGNGCNHASFVISNDDSGLMKQASQAEQEEILNGASTNLYSNTSELVSNNGDLGAVSVPERGDINLSDNITINYDQSGYNDCRIEIYINNSLIYNFINIVDAYGQNYNYTIDMDNDGIKELISVYRDRFIIYKYNINTESVYIEGIYKFGNYLSSYVQFITFVDEEDNLLKLGMVIGGYVKSTLFKFKYANEKINAYVWIENENIQTTATEGNTASFNLRIYANSTGVLNIDISENRAVINRDYIINGGTQFNYAIGINEYNLAIEFKADNFYERLESFTITLRQENGNNMLLNNNQSVTYYIIDNTERTVKLNTSSPFYVVGATAEINANELSPDAARYVWIVNGITYNTTSSILTLPNVSMGQKMVTLIAYDNLDNEICYVVDSINVVDATSFTILENSKVPSNINALGMLTLKYKVSIYGNIVPNIACKIIFNGVESEIISNEQGIVTFNINISTYGIYEFSITIKNAVFQGITLSVPTVRKTITYELENIGAVYTFYTAGQNLAIKNLSVACVQNNRTQYGCTNIDGMVTFYISIGIPLNLYINTEDYIYNDLEIVDILESREIDYTYTNTTINEVIYLKTYESNELPTFDSYDIYTMSSLFKYRYRPDQNDTPYEMDPMGTTVESRPTYSYDKDPINRDVSDFTYTMNTIRGTEVVGGRTYERYSVGTIIELKMTAKTMSFNGYQMVVKLKLNSFDTSNLRVYFNWYNDSNNYIRAGQNTVNYDFYSGRYTLITSYVDSDYMYITATLYGKYLNEVGDGDYLTMVIKTGGLEYETNPLLAIGLDPIEAAIQSADQTMAILAATNTLNACYVEGESFTPQFGESGYTYEIDQSNLTMKVYMGYAANTKSLDVTEDPNQSFGEGLLEDAVMSIFSTLGAKINTVSGAIMEMRYNNKRWEPVNLQACYITSMNDYATFFQQQFVVPVVFIPVPVYVNISMRAAIQTQFELAWRNIQEYSSELICYHKDGDITYNLGIKVEGGIGVDGIVGVGAWGAVDTSLKVHDNGNCEFGLKFSGGGTVYLTIFSFSYEFASFEVGNYEDLYNSEFLNMPIGQLKLIDKAIYIRQHEIGQYTEGSGITVDVIIDTLNPSVKPQMVNLSDNRKMIVWNDTIEKDGNIIEVLSYGILENGILTDIGTVDNDTFGDSEFTLTTLNGKAQIVYSKQRIYTESLSNSFKFAEMAVAEFDGTNWTVKKLTDDIYRDYAPIIATDGDNGIIVFQKNTNNDYNDENTITELTLSSPINNKILYSVYHNGYNTVNIAKTNIGNIVSSALGVYNNKAYYIFEVDDDSNLLTYDDKYFGYIVYDFDTGEWSDLNKVVLYGGVKSVRIIKANDTIYAGFISGTDLIIYDLISGDFKILNENFKAESFYTASNENNIAFVYSGLSINENGEIIKNLFSIMYYPVLDEISGEVLITEAQDVNGYCNLNYDDAGNLEILFIKIRQFEVVENDTIITYEVADLGYVVKSFSAYLSIDENKISHTKENGIINLSLPINNSGSKIATNITINIYSDSAKTHLLATKNIARINPNSIENDLINITVGENDIDLFIEIVCNGVDIEDDLIEYSTVNVELSIKSIDVIENNGKVYAYATIFNNGLSNALNITAKFYNKNGEVLETVLISKIYSNTAVNISALLSNNFTGNDFYAKLIITSEYVETNPYDNELSSGFNTLLKERINATSITSTTNSMAIKKDEKENLLVLIEPLNAKVIYTTSNSSVVTVSNSGTITAVGKGNAFVTVWSEDGSVSKTIFVTVYENDINEIILSR